MIRSDGNSWSTKTIAAGATHAGAIEPTTQYATASIAVTSSTGGTLRVFRGPSTETVVQVETMILPEGVPSTFIVPAIESHFQLRLESIAASPTVSTCEVYYYSELATPITSHAKVSLIDSVSGSTGGIQSVSTASIDVSQFRDVLLHINPGTGQTGLAYFHIYCTTPVGNQYMHGIWTESGTHAVNLQPTSDSGTSVIAAPVGAHTVFVQFTQTAPYGSHTYIVEAFGRKF
jgi:hypothetical protein